MSFSASDEGSVKRRCEFLRVLPRPCDLLRFVGLPNRWSPAAPPYGGTREVGANHRVSGCSAALSARARQLTPEARQKERPVAPSSKLRRACLRADCGSRPRRGTRHLERWRRRPRFPGDRFGRLRADSESAVREEVGARSRRSGADRRFRSRGHRHRHLPRLQGRADDVHAKPVSVDPRRVVVRVPAAARTGAIAVVSEFGTATTRGPVSVAPAPKAAPIDTAPGGRFFLGGRRQPVFSFDGDTNGPVQIQVIRESDGSVIQTLAATAVAGQRTEALGREHVNGTGAERPVPLRAQRPGERCREPEPRLGLRPLRPRLPHPRASQPGLHGDERLRRRAQPQGAGHVRRLRHTDRCRA